MNGQLSFEEAEEQLREWERNGELVDRLQDVWDEKRHWTGKLTGTYKSKVDFSSYQSKECQLKMLEYDWEIHDDEEHTKGSNMTLDFLSNNILVDGERLEKENLDITEYGWTYSHSFDGGDPEYWCLGFGSKSHDDKIFGGNFMSNGYGDVKLNLHEFTYAGEKCIKEHFFHAYPKKKKTMTGKRSRCEMTPRKMDVKKRLFS